MATPETTRPSDVSGDRSWYDHVADKTSTAVARAPFFLVCVGFLVAWAVAGPFVDFSHAWVDALQTVAAMVTFVMVALLENESWRNGKATQRKLNAIAAALADMMENADADQEQVRELRAAVGLEKRESASR